ncbi:hypothetical protein [Thalassospira lucentensis]|uniref:Cupin 2 conserved barrel domain-containing protein n=1 Tax=Thalassospira lucentensis TaxID=168935 RepID=A0A358HXJ5_9PROT|nr:hypothetical protein [Thalassospira lucentensis]HBU99900.1 hypothetical protein [Thalassospira lucentensis]HCW68991.1 hypothetical protein [Thalassospira lucentensis]|tara:strand:- start:2332 stop:2700 length:369 start_codon:yes stop_codon:yes gene_type:complete
MLDRGYVQGVPCVFEAMSSIGTEVSLEMSEVLLQGPCVVSGVQTACAEELIFVLSGDVEISEIDGKPMERHDNCFSILRGQRYHLNVTSSEPVKLMRVLVPAFQNAGQAALAKAQITGMVLN